MREHLKAWHEDCIVPGCYICEGGLFECSVCELAEGALTTECSGEESDRLHGDTVYAGDEDFVNGKWQTGRCSPHSPASRGRKS